MSTIVDGVTWNQHLKADPSRDGDRLGRHSMADMDVYKANCAKERILNLVCDVVKTDNAHGYVVA